MHEPYHRTISVTRPPELGGNEWHLTNLTNVVVIFGKNSSGKSKLLRAWRDAQIATTHYIVPERTGELDYQPNYLQQQLDSKSRRDQSQRNFSNEYRRQIVARIQAYFAARGDYRGDTAPSRPDDIEMYVGRLLPDFILNISGTANPPYQLHRSSDDQPVGGIDHLSSGEAQILILAMDILTIAGIWEIQGADTRIMLVDEPDVHVHPDLLARLADFLLQVTEKYKLQIIIATHSTSLLAALGQFGGEHVSVLFLDRTKTEFRAEPFSEVMKDLAACLGGHALMGPLFSVPLLLVEGDDDYRIWSQVPRHHFTSFSVIPSGGQEITRHQRVLERVFSALREDAIQPSGYALVDGDKGKPEANPVTPQMHVRFIQLNCRESENLFLADEVLNEMGTTWPDAQAKIRAEADQFGEKAEALQRVIEADRQRDDIKEVIEQLSNIIDPKRIHWTIRVAAVIGKARPTGQISNFLGREVTDALWGPEPAV